MKKIILSVCMLCLSMISVYAQKNEKESYQLPDNWYVNANFDSSLFWNDLRVNDLCPVDKYQNERKWTYGGILEKKITSWFDLRGQFLTGELSGIKRIVNEYFNAEYYEYNSGLVIDWVNIICGYNPDLFTDITPTEKEIVKNNQDLSIMRAYNVYRKVMENSSFKQERVKITAMGSSIHLLQKTLLPKIRRRIAEQKQQKQSYIFKR